MTMRFINDYATVLLEAIDEEQTTMQVADSEPLRALQPKESLTLTINEGSTEEIICVTSVQDSSLTIKRAQENTIAQRFNAGAEVAMRLTAGNLNNFLEKDDNLLTLKNKRIAFDAIKQSATTYYPGVVKFADWQMLIENEDNKVISPNYLRSKLLTYPRRVMGSIERIDDKTIFLPLPDMFARSSRIDLLIDGPRTDEGKTFAIQFGDREKPITSGYNYTIFSMRNGLIAAKTNQMITIGSDYCIGNIFSGFLKMQFHFSPWMTFCIQLLEQQKKSDEQPWPLVIDQYNVAGAYSILSPKGIWFSAPEATSLSITQVSWEGIP